MATETEYIYEVRTGLLNDKKLADKICREINSKYGVHVEVRIV